MIVARRCRLPLAMAALTTALMLGGCGYSPERSLTASNAAPQQTASTAGLPAGKDGRKQTNKTASAQRRQVVATNNERDCLVRAMYFESNRSSRDGLLAVGTVVMNRVESPSYPKSICGVVGQHRQFASGVLSRPMSARERAHADAVADQILSGKRHDAIGDAMFFHVASRRYKYPNMRYLTVAGGNIFYEKVGRRAPAAPSTMLAYADTAKQADAAATQPKATVQAPAAATQTIVAAAQPAAAPAANATDAIAAIIEAPRPAANSKSFTAPVDEALSRARSFSSKPLVLASYRSLR